MTAGREDLANLVVTLVAMGHSRRQIAEDLKVSRNTVRSILERVELQRQQGHSVIPDLEQPKNMQPIPWLTGSMNTQPGGSLSNRR